MTGKIERQVDEHHTTLRLIGHLHAAHLEALQAQLESSGPRTVLDLDQVTLVDVEVVRFLGACEAGRHSHPPWPTLYPRVDLAGTAARANTRHEGEHT